MPEGEHTTEKNYLQVEIRAISFTGMQALSEETARKELLPEFVGKIGTPETVREAAQALLNLYRQKGFSVATVTNAEVTPEGVLTFDVAEGKIRSIRILGNSRTRTRTIRSVLTLEPGDVYREQAIRADRERLARLGIFLDVKIGAEIPGVPPKEGKEGKDGAKDTNVDPDTEEEADDTRVILRTPVQRKTDAETAEKAAADAKKAEEPGLPLAEPILPVEDRVGLVDLVVRVQERQTVNIAATIGYSDGIGTIGFIDLSESNLLGTASQVSLSWQRTATIRFREDGTAEAENARSAFEFGYQVPPLGQQSLGYGIEVYDKNTVFLPFFSGGQETLRSYELRRGVRGSVGKRFTENLSAFLTVRRDEVGYDAIPDRLNPPIDALLNADGTVGGLGIAVIADGRDQADSPRRGYRHELTVERAGSFFGGNRLFTQSTLDLRGYFPLTPIPREEKNLPVVLAVRLLGGYSTGDVPLSEQFFLGGFDFLRGYDLFSIYGSRSVLGVAEVRFPVGEALQAVAFTELGNAWQPGQQVSVRDLRGSIGAGLRFLSPIGPIRLDAAYGSRFQTYVSLGQSF
ncbi:MAG: hypothetical protein OHK0029_39650 [Armatimonadaceae bacterium]